jgi:hypothetical protein
MDSPVMTTMEARRSRRLVICWLTLALSGRAMSAAARRGRTMYQGARGAHPPTHDGPLERVVSWLCAVLHEAHDEAFFQAAQPRA